MKKILFNLLAFVLLLPAWSMAQSTPFTVLRNNTNIDTNYLYVEIMYERIPCDEHIAQFGVQDLRNSQTDTTWTIRIDSILNNEGTYELNEDTTLLMRPKAGGYKLRFLRADFPGDASTSDSVLICVKSSRVPFLCKGCAAAGSDALFALEKDILTGCPYPNTGGDYGDLLACYKRTSQAANWEAWIRDSRDCKPYRIVLMPDNKWWLAQNLNYTKGLTDGVTAGVGGVQPGYYWCPGATRFDSIAKGKMKPVTGLGSTPISGGDTACRTYGAFYTNYTAIQEDGIFPFDTANNFQYLSDTLNTSRIRGICPAGWFIPNFYDWGMMFNFVEGCTQADISANEYHCQTQKYSVITKSSPFWGKTFLSKLKSTHSAPRDVSHGSGRDVDSIYATKTNPAWSWYTQDVNDPEYKKNLHGNAQDKFGFSMLPAGFKDSNGFACLGKSAMFTVPNYFGTKANLYVNNSTGRLIWWLDIDSESFGTFASWNYGGSIRCIRAAN